MTSKCKTCDTCNLCKCEKFQPEDEIIVKDWKQKGCGKQFCYVKDCKMGCFLCHIHFLCPSCSNQSPQRRSETPNKKQNEGTHTLSDKRIDFDGKGYVYPEKDLKQSIKKLLESGCNCGCCRKFRGEIKREFGDKLV